MHLYTKKFLASKSILHQNQYFTKIILVFVRGYEIRCKDTSGAFRVIYVAKFADAVYVLHAFQKKTEKTTAHLPADQGQVGGFQPGYAANAGRPHGHEATVAVDRLNGCKGQALGHLVVHTDLSYHANGITHAKVFALSDFISRVSFSP
jgi:hypothetical protein